MASDDLDSLFAAAPPDFIEERRRIVAALKGAGRKDDAKAVEKIPRPSLAVWTINQIARRDPEVVHRLGDVTERLQSAAGPDYATAAGEHRTVLQELRDRAGEVLSEAGHEISPHIIQRVIANLRAAAGSAESRATLEKGRLVRDVEEPEMVSLFGVASDGEAPSDDERPAAAPLKAVAAAPKASTAATAAEVKAQERARAKAAAVAERGLKRLRDAETAARKEVDRAERTVAAARQSLQLAEIRAASARAAAEEATRAHAQAEADLARQPKG